MAFERAHVVVRTAERLKIVAEGQPVSSADRVTIERAVDDIYAMLKTELRLTWTLDDIPAENIGPLTVLAASMAASATDAPDAPTHEAKWDFGLRQLRVINRLRPDNSKPVKVVHY